MWTTCTTLYCAVKESMTSTLSSYRWSRKPSPKTPRHVHFLQGLLGNGVLLASSASGLLRRRQLEDPDTGRQRILYVYLHTYIGISSLSLLSVSAMPGAKA